MAVLTNGIQFTGSIGDITGYTRKDSDKIYARRKGGTSRQRILTDPAFELTRQNYSEFSGCGKAAKAVRLAMLPVAHLRAFNLNISPRATKLAKVLQKMDTTGARGQRSIYFSHHRSLLEGFNLHPAHSLDTIVGPLIHCDINRSTGSATVQLPAMTPGLNLLLPWSETAYRFIVYLSALPDICKDASQEYRLPERYQLPYAGEVYTAWQYTRHSYAGETIEIQLKNLETLTDAVSLVLSVGVEMGTAVTDQLVTAVPKGSAKIMRLG